MKKHPSRWQTTLSSLRSRSEAERRSIALAGALSITGLTALGWGVFALPGYINASMKDEQTAAVSSPLQGLAEEGQKLFGGISEGVSVISESMGSTKDAEPVEEMSVTLTSPENVEGEPTTETSSGLGDRNYYDGGSEYPSYPTRFEEEGALGEQPVTGN